MATCRHPANKGTGAFSDAGPVLIPSAVILILAAVALVPTPTASACTTPVFQYALERWAPDLYEIRVVKHTQFTPPEEEAVALLKKHEDGEEALANILVNVVDADAEQTETPGKNRIEVYFPRSAPERNPIWKGPISTQTAKQVLESPVRRNIARNLLAGDAVVWILLEIGDKQKDDEAAAEVRKHLDMLQKELQLPDDPYGAPEDEQEQQDEEAEPGPRFAKFSILRVARNTPEEAFFTALLLKTEPDLHEFQEPMAFPVFGRARVLYALVGKGINEDTIAEASVYLCGACSCQVKAQNPGVDLLTGIDWEAALATVMFGEEPPPTLTGILPNATDADGTMDEGDGRPQQEAEDAPPGEEVVNPTLEADTAPPDKPNALLRNVLILFALATAAVVVSTVAVQRKGRRDE